MASPQVAIAKAAFSAVLLRSDPVPCSRSQIDEFFAQLDATVSRCSSENVQKSKQWILAHVVHSPARVAALAKFFLALANSFTSDLLATRKSRELSTKRRRLHLLYVLNDCLYHIAVRQNDHSFAANLQPSLLGLVQSAAAFADAPKHIGKISALINLWKEREYLEPAFINKIRQVIVEAPKTQNTSSATNGAADNSSKSSRDAPFALPAMHGDATVPWYDLPAANWLPVIEPNSTRPMNPEMIKPLQFSTGPVDKLLVKAVEDLLADVDRIYSKEDSSRDSRMADTDQLGQRVTLDEATGAITGGETYYGWSRSFCEKMKQRRNKKATSGNRQRGRGISRSSSHSRSPSSSRSRSRSSSHASLRPAFKRRRVSESPGSRQDRGRGRSRSRSPEYDRIRDYGRSDYSRRRKSFTGSRSRSRSYSRPESRGESRARSPTYGSSRPYTKSPNPQPHPGAPDQIFQPLPPASANHTTFAQSNQYGNTSFTPHPQFTVPTPPPRPPNYQGPWPPPPPPMGSMAVPPPNWMPPVSHFDGSAWATQHPPPPPPPPPSQQQGQGQSEGVYHQYGRGGARGEYRGQGYRGGGPGRWHRGGGRGW